MALIKCKECSQDVSSKADKCPHCGVKLKKSGSGCSTFLIIGIVILIGLYLLGSMGNGDGVITDDITYSESWRSPYGSEFREIGQIIVKNKIKVCGEYYVKEIESGEYVIACSADGKSWDYFVVYKSIGEIYRANNEMESKLYPPR